VRLNASTFVVTDTETTGTRAGEDRLIEVAAVKVRGGEVVDTFQQLINPERSVPRRITSITGISTAMVYGQPTAREVLPGFLDFLGDGVLVAHNLPFDHRFLAAELDRAGLPPLACEAVCTLRLARRLLPALPSRGLTALAGHYAIANRARHRALGDAEVTAEVLLRFLDRLSAGFGVSTLEELLTFQHRRYRDTSGEARHVQAIRTDVLPGLPDRPGVYTFKRRNGEVLYVGKAKSLSGRVRSYFSAIDSHPERLRRLVRDVRVVEWEETGSELAALLLESRRIKVLQPRFNRAQRRYRDYPFLRLDTRHGYPSLSFVHTIAADGAEYYGPLGRRGRAEEIVEIVDQHFGLRKCDLSTWRSAAAHRQACLYHELERCLAPCLGERDTIYGAEVEQVRAFLRGDGTEVLAGIQRAMREAAAALEFERAGELRDRHRRLGGMLERQRPFGSPVHDLHAILLEPDARGGVQAFLLRFGRLVERLDLPVGIAPEDHEHLRQALARHFDASLESPEAYLRSEVDEIRILAQWVHQHEGNDRILRWTPGDDLDALVATIAGAEGVGVEGRS
jgi:DNA polymerase III subunit epsilon